MTRVVGGWLTTTGRVDAYGGISLSKEMIYVIADQTRAERGPIYVNHDTTQALPMRYTLVDVREHPSGELGVYVEFEVEDDNHDLNQYHAFSISFIGNPIPPDPSSDKPRICLYVDAGCFEDGVYESAVQALEAHFAVGTGKLYQFSVDVPIVVIIEFARTVLVDLPAALFNGILFEVLKSKFLKRGESDKETTVRMNVKGPEGTIRTVVKTNSPEVLDKALESFKTVALAAQGNTLLVFDEQAGQWESGDLPPTT